MSSFKLFFKRFRNNFLFQYNVIKSVADWTVMLYIIIPTVVIGGMIYRSWWIEIPEWAVSIPFELFFLIPFLYILTGYFRTYILGADQVFLVKHYKVFLGLKKWGVSSTYGMTLILTAGIGVLIAPFWLQHYNTGLFVLLIYLLFLLSSKWSHMAIKGKLARLQKGWRRTLLFYLTIIVQLQLWGAAYQFIYHRQYIILAAEIIVLMTASFVMNRRRIHSKNSIQRDLRIEGDLKVKWISLIFMFSYQVEKELVSSERTRPRLFSKSQVVFKRRTPFFGYLELFTKALIRNFTYSTTYFQSIGALTFSQVVLPPLWLKLGAAGLVALSILAWNEWVWTKLISKHPIGNKYSSKTELLKAQTATRIAAFIPYFCIIAFTLLRYLGVFS
ncbi:ABC transporter permease [Bacillus salacetis]|uniref:ABC transporter permease n=1 Tax=Bacillus salacetis TaxID=2315464 RepID=UPI003BA19925